MSDNDTEELKNCPFCGGEAEMWGCIYEDEEDGGVTLNHHPKDCPLNLAVVFSTKEAAIKAWNTRHTEPRSPAIDDEQIERATAAIKAMVTDQLLTRSMTINLRSLAKAALQAAGTTGWRDISTAPKDKKISLWVGNGYLHGHMKTGIVDPKNYDAGIYSYWDAGESAGMILEKYARYWQPITPPAVEDK